MPFLFKLLGFLFFLVFPGPAGEVPAAPLVP